MQRRWLVFAGLPAIPLAATTAASQPTPSLGQTAVATLLPATKLSDEQLRAKCLEVFSGTHQGAARYTATVKTTSTGVSPSNKDYTFEFKTAGEILTDPSGKRFCTATLSWWNAAYNSTGYNYPIAFNGEAAISWDPQYYASYPQYYVTLGLMPDGSLNYHNYVYVYGNRGKPAEATGTFKRK